MMRGRPLKSIIRQGIVEILYLGDLLVPYGDFFNRNYPLCKPGYVEQYWLEEVLKNGGKSELFPSFDEAKKISEKFKVSLHPNFIYYWNQISYDNFLDLVDWLAHGNLGESFVLPYDLENKERLAK